MRDPMLEALRDYEFKEAMWQEEHDTTLDELEEEIQEYIEEFEELLRKELGHTEMREHILDNLEIYYKL